MRNKPYRLSAAFVRTVKTPGRYGDGRGSGGLSLMVKATARGDLAKSWAQRLIVDGRPRMIGLGSYPHVSLAEAREACILNRAALRRGDLVLAGRKRSVPTFEEAVEKVVQMHAEGWKDGGKSAAQWRSSLAAYALPKLGPLPVNRVTTADVMAVLLPIWSTKQETARRVRQRVGAIMRWAVAKGYREDNPAGDAIGAALPKNGVRRKHQAALPHEEVSGALAKVRASGAYPTTVLAFEFLVLTACRSGEVRGARWEEIDLEAATWCIPSERMKSKREHRVPLARGALAVLTRAEELADNSGLCFPSPSGRELSDATISKLLRELAVAAVPHGFRSSFRDWAAECSDSSREVCEAALAHAVRDRTEAAYKRTTMFQRRRVLMEQWGAYAVPA